MLSGALARALSGVLARALSGVLARALWLALAGLQPTAAFAGTLDQATLQQLFPSPLVMGARDSALPIWPIFKQNGPATDLVGYVFESIDLAPIPGFSGTPVNLLVALDPDGRFLDVRVLSQHEPVFLDGLGEGPMLRFVDQYKGLSLRQNIRIVPPGTRPAANGAIDVHIDGVAKATASVRIINQTMLSAALKVARAKLGFTGAKDPGQVARLRPGLPMAPHDWAGLLDAGLVQHLALAASDVDRGFAGTAVANQGPGDEGGRIDLYVALASLPEVGRNLLDERTWTQMNSRLREGDLVLLVMSTPDAFVGEDFVRGAVPERLALRQGGLPIEMRDMDLDGNLAAAGLPAIGAWKAFRVIAASGLDLGQPIDLALRVTRSHGIVYAEKVTREFTATLRVDSQYVIASGADERGWAATWAARAPELALLVAALALLAWSLARGSRLVTDTRWLRWFRPAFLLLTLGFIGFAAQGQLSIVNLVAALQSATRGGGWDFLLYDPISTVLWVFVLASLVVWGRGTFCGWLCPFGALQELVALAARALRLPLWQVPAGIDRQLRRLKYLLLAATLAAAVLRPAWADLLVEVEPFKTAITLAFVRHPPFVVYAVLLVLAAAMVNKPFCRYLCPLGAALALAGRARRWDWLARRAECGRPCQTCRYACEYRAIDRDGRIDYQECFQCMACVAIHRDEQRCAPLILVRHGRPPMRVGTALQPPLSPDTGRGAGVRGPSKAPLPIKATTFQGQAK